MTTFESSRPQDKVSILKRVPVFASCTDDQLLLIAERTRLVEYKKGELIYRQGDPADAFYIISSGRLRVFRTAGQQERTITVLHNGDSFGEISLLTGEMHSATVEALNDTLVLQLEKKDFDEVINRIPSLVLYLSRLLSKRLRTSTESGQEFTESTIVGIYGAAAGVGRTSFGVSLATLLKRETGRPVVVVDFSGARGQPGWLHAPLDPASVAPGSESEESFAASIAEHALGFSVILADQLLTGEGGERTIAPLLSFLTNRFAYILLELPAAVEPGVVKALVQSDLVYFVTTAAHDDVLRTSATLRQLQSAMAGFEQRSRLVLNLRHAPEGATPLAEITQQLGRKPAHVLPHVISPSGQLTLAELTDVLNTRGAPYTAAVRYVARDLGGLLVGLALGSGAALGLAHIGVLKVIEREKIPIDILAGSSIGAMIGGLWAAGKTAAELETMALSFKNPWDVRRLFILDMGIPLFGVAVGLVAGLFVGWLAEFWTGMLFGLMVTVAVSVVLGPLAGGPIQGANLMEKLREDFSGKHFEDTWLPLKIVAANPMAREEVVFESGPLADAVRASVSIPGIFKPVIYQGKVCLDGGVINPIPVSVLKRAGAHRIIAVNVFPTSAELALHREVVHRRRLERDAALATKSLPVRLLVRVQQELIRTVSPLVFDVIMRSMQSMEHQIAEVASREADLTLRPTVAGAHWLEFFHPEPFIRRGEEVALQYLPELKRITRMRDVDKV